MIKINEKWMLFFIATFTIFFGIANEFFKGTEARIKDVVTNDIVMLDFDDGGLRDIILGDIDIDFNSNVYAYDIKINELNNLSVIPILSNDNITYMIDIIGDVMVDKNVEVVIKVNIGYDNEKIYKLFIEEVDKE